MEKQNREQRRREKFGRAGKVSQHDPLGPWPESEANPALLKNVPADRAALAVGPEEDTSDPAVLATENAPETAGTAPSRKVSRPNTKPKG